jgi:hypothetical protein
MAAKESANLADEVLAHEPKSKPAHANNLTAMADQAAAFGWGVLSAVSFPLGCAIGLVRLPSISQISFFRLITSPSHLRPPNTPFSLDKDYFYILLFC